MGDDTKPGLANAGETREAPLAWPPPGLEGLQGAAWPILTVLGLGGALMTLPMLWILTVRTPFWSPGPLAGAWWLPSAASLIGLLLVVSAIVRGALLLRAGARGVAIGYDGRTVAYVACDATRDAGFLLQGLRQYASLVESEREWLLGARVTAAAAYGVGLLWIPVSFAAGVVLAVRGVLPVVGSIWTLVLAPAGLLLLIGICARTVDRIGARRARAEWRRSGQAAGLARYDAAKWLEARSARFGTPLPRARGTRAPRLAAAGLGALALMLPLPVVLLALLSTAGPLLTRATPRFGSQAGGIARTEILRPYALPSDSTISAKDAGETLQVLAYVGRPNKHRLPVERAPVRVYAQSWATDDAPESLRPLEQLVRRGLERHESLTPEELAYVERVAAHPAHAEFERLARAPDADIAGGRWDAGAFSDTNMWELPILSFGRVREFAHAHLARGVLEAQRGDAAAAETTFREVISVGLLLARTGPTLIDLLIGGSVAHSGARALHLFYESTGRAVDAAAIRLALEGVEAADAAAKSLLPLGDADGSLRGRMAVAANANVPPGLRWESLMSARLSAGCLNANAALFGDEGYDTWLDEMRASLVRFPSEDALFELMEKGLVPPADVRRKTEVVQRLLQLTFGQSESASDCVALAAAVTMLF